MHFNSGKPFTDSPIRELSESNLIHLADTMCKFILQVANMDGKITTPEEFAAPLHQSAFRSSTHYTIARQNIMSLVITNRSLLRCSFEDSKFDGYVWDYVSQHLLSEVWSKPASYKVDC